MAITNGISNTLTNRQPKFSVAIKSEAYQNLINNTLRDSKRANRFIANIMTAVSANPTLQECEASTILSAGLLGETLNLSPSPQLGQFYLVPFNDKNKGKTAQFQLGYKGYIQLAIRSGYYKKLNVLAIKKDELIKYDPLNEEIEVELIEDDEVRENAETIGYYAMFEYENGFRKTLYWSKKKMHQHALKYSQGYRSDVRNNTQYTFWSKDFDGMAYKTMLRQLISKWGIMSIDMQEAYTKDQSVIDKDGNYSYVDNVEDLPLETPVETKTEVKEKDEKKTTETKQETYIQDGFDLMD